MVRFNTQERVVEIFAVEVAKQKWMVKLIDGKIASAALQFRLLNPASDYSKSTLEMLTHASNDARSKIIASHEFRQAVSRYLHA